MRLEILNFISCWQTYELSSDRLDNGLSFYSWLYRYVSVTSQLAHVILKLISRALFFEALISFISAFRVHFNV